MMSKWFGRGVVSMKEVFVEVEKAATKARPNIYDDKPKHIAMEQ